MVSAADVGTESGPQQHTPITIQRAPPPVWLRPITWCAAQLLRFLSGLYRVLHKIDNTCPACRVSAPPLYCCPRCGNLHDELRPSVNGVWTVLCACAVPLATTDAGGRAAYRRVCRNPD